MNSRINNQENQDQQIFTSSSNTTSTTEDNFRLAFFTAAAAAAAANSATTTTTNDTTTQANNQTSSQNVSTNNLSTTNSSKRPSQSSSSVSSNSTNSLSPHTAHSSLVLLLQISPSNSSNSLLNLQSNKRARLDVSLSQQHQDDLDSICSSSPSPNTPTNLDTTTTITPLLEKPLQDNIKIDEQHHPNISNIKRYRSRSLPNVIFSAFRRRRHHHHHHHHHHHTRNNLQQQHLQQQQYHNFGGAPSDSIINAVPSMAFSFPQQQSFFPSTDSNNNLRQSIKSSPPLPPVNSLSLREIDLHEILKNPQLRHDILFDPQLQFRPNLDGERGRKKKMAVDKYWEDVERECEFYSIYKKFDHKESRLPLLFQTLKEILISLLPTKDVEQVNEVMDIDLLIQQLNNFAFDFVSLAKWLSQILKSHCAPMRDSWVDEMTLKFSNLQQNNSVTNLVEGLRMIFSILELMKLDVANHQIRILRPVLVETAIDFERNYFTQMVNRGKMTLQDSTNWFITNYQNCDFKPIKLKQLSTLSILKLLSCRHMVTSFPTSLSFDHARLVLLRADIRQLVCLQLCIVLYKQLIHQYCPSSIDQLQLLKIELISNLKKQILAIVTDDNGNIKWTRNVDSILLQLSKLCINLPDNDNESNNFKTPPESMVEFAFNWLIKQTQPSSQVYGLMEERIFKQLLDYVNNSKDDELLKEDLSNTTTASSSSTNTTNTTNTTVSSKASDNQNDENLELNQLGSRVAKLCNFHWSVFGNTYTEAVSKL